uniref:Hexosyltransferase n=1 Tax=Xiphophorus couchianus TaxID=32473 RepID=A0A3B5N1M8_9TELE
MLRFPVKKIRKQFKLLLLLVLLTSAVWFTYLHINQSKTIKLHFNYGKGERQTDGTDASRKRDTRSSAGHHKSEDTSDSREDEDDEPIIGGADSRDQTHIRTFLSQKQKKLLWKPELGTEWTAPGEFTKFRSQSSKSVLISSRRYYFEILHKQDDKGSDHVEVGWRPFLPGLKYEVIDSAYISLYTESSLKMNSVDHIPQTLASHIHLPAEFRPQGLEGDIITPHGADMLRPDPRDTFYSPMIDHTRLQNVLPACLYSPTYVVKDFPIARYQGLQFVYLSFVYPNDFTRLTHMERENKCFYRESPIYLEFGFYKYMKMDEEEDDRPFFFPNPDPDVDSVVRGRTLSWVYTGPSDQDLNKKAKAQGGRGDLEVPPKISKSSLLFPQKTSLSALTSRAKQILSNSAHSNYPHTNSNKPVGSKKEKREESKIYITRPRPAKEREKEREQRRERREERASRHPREVFPGVFLYQTGKTTRLVNLGQRRHGGRGGSVVRHLIGAPQLWHSPPTKDSKTSAHNKSVNIQSETAERSFNKVAMTKQLEKIKRKGESRDLRTTVTADLPSKKDIQIPLSYHQEPPPTPASETRLSYTENTIHSQLRVTSYLRTSEITESIYTLLRIINVEKRRDSARGNRYLVELELMERGRSVVRLSEYIYLLLHHGRQGEESVENTDSAPASAPTPLPSASATSFTTQHPSPSTRSSVRPGATPWSTAYAKPLLCQPVMLQWRRDVMVHFVVPKNQARWVQQFISDMENLHQQTKDDNFSIIIVDFESEDMDVEQALRDSSVPYEYLRREGNFERSAGLQIGVDTIKDSHSIVFLCDLHIHFPLNILESIRKHCVEGRLAFAPIVMRLSCGSSPLEPDYWEVNGFGLFGIYKSDFDKIGGMNTEEFKDRWGGEDWELLDVLQNGLEVERLRLRNFFHYYHSKRGMWNSQNKKTS